MVQRHAQLSFGTAFAFPGGVIDPDDTRVDRFCHGLEAADANLRLGVEKDGLAYYSAAIRELFEETGVFLSDYSNVDDDLGSIRAALNSGSLGWADFIGSYGLELRCDQLHYIDHWITPEDAEKRYSARFFLTELPEGQVADHCGGELTASRWTTAGDMLDAERRGDVRLIFPTIKTLERVARHRSVESLLEWAKSKADWGITTMVPVTIQRHGKTEIVLPGDRDYPGAKT